MNRVYSLILCAALATTVCSCSESKEDKLHDQCVETFKSERIEEAKLEVESLKKEIAICEYILGIKDNEEFIKALDFLEEKTEDSKKWTEEFEAYAKEMELKIELAENKADEVEMATESRAYSFDLMQ